MTDSTVKFDHKKENVPEAIGMTKQSFNTLADLVIATLKSDAVNSKSEAIEEVGIAVKKHHFGDDAEATLSPYEVSLLAAGGMLSQAGCSDCPLEELMGALKSISRLAGIMVKMGRRPDDE